MRRYVRNTSGGCPHGRQENDITVYARLASGLCALSIVLVFGGLGGPVAAADTESDKSDKPVSESQGSAGTETKVESSPPSSTLTTVHSTIGETTPTTVVRATETETETTPATTVHTAETETTSTSTTVHTAEAETTTPPTPGFDAGSLFGTNQEVASGETSARQTGEEPMGGSGPMTLGATTVSQTGADAPATTTDGNKGSDTVPADATAAQTNDPAVTVSHTPVTESTPPSSTPATQEATPPPSSAPAAAPVQEPAAQPVANDTAVIEKSSQVEAAPLNVGPAAAGNLLAVLAYLFIGSPNGGPPLISLPSSILSFLGLPFMGEVPTAPVVAGGIGGSLFAGGVLTATRAALTSPLSAQGNWPGSLIIASGGAPSLLAPSAEVVRGTMSGVSAGGVESEHLSLAMGDSLLPEQVRSVLRHTVGAVLAPLSLLVLAVMASPGLTGLVLLGAAGTFVGYRQARAASILRAVGIARFVKAGPLGVVRSGGLVAVHSRTSRSFSRHSDQASASLDTVA
jgi:hypothetical protein